MRRNAAEYAALKNEYERYKEITEKRTADLKSRVEDNSVPCTPTRRTGPGSR